ncbi:hypothetical protein [Brucella tritici]|uniref:hypothetical protein n=1 Tax=Brucella tritici TaxID=94626 RepID=UPI00200192C8|nr:hypothetical protein [Brucella tritici]
MPTRIKFSTSGVYVSQPGYDVDTANQRYLGMFPNMGVMAQVLDGSVTLSAGGSQDYSITNPTGKMPYVFLTSSTGEHPDRTTFCAETSIPYNYVRIRNISGPTRTIRFAALIDNT